MSEAAIAPVVIVHGGAWQIPASRTKASLDGVQTAAETAHAALRKGMTALCAVELAVASLEDDPAFDAGHGSCLTTAGTVEMDAAVMTDDAAFGAVAALSASRNPIAVARAVLSSHHCLLVADGADAFAKEAGFAPTDPACLVTEEAKAEWAAYSQYGAVVSDLFNSGHDTVGAAALDGRGRMACATSTGGITFKRVGRVGDSPLPGCGLYCERGVAAASATGHGESIMRVVLSKQIVDLVHMRSVPIDQATRDALEKMRELTGGYGGVVALDASGKWSARCTTGRMAWACVDATQALHVGIERDQVLDCGPVSGKHEDEPKPST